MDSDHVRGLRRSAVIPVQRLTPLAIDRCPSGAGKGLQTPTPGNENGKETPPPNGPPFASPPGESNAP
jgi:hypothetical protein